MKEPLLPLHTDIAEWRDKKIFDALPVPAAILDAEENVVYANEQLSSTFGPWQGRKCSEVYQKKEICEDGSCSIAFSGLPHTSQAEGLSQQGQVIRYTKYSMPLCDLDGSVPYVMELCIDNSSIDILRREYQSLFDLVPCSIIIINKDLVIIDSNQAVRNIYGDLEGKQCHTVLKGQDNMCGDCVAKLAFTSKKPQNSMQVWSMPDGREAHMQVTAVPILDNENNVTAIMEMAVDITEIIYLRDQDELKTLMLTSIVENSLRGIVVITDNGDIPIINNGLNQLFGFPSIGISDPDELYRHLPENVNKAIASGVDRFHFNEVLVCRQRVEGGIPVAMHGRRLKHAGKSLGLVLSFQDLRQQKAQETSRMETERLVAVGQTVSGLAHGIKNLVTALEGGMYMLTSGMQGGKAERIAQGINMLERNISRIEGFVKNFLHFARGREIKPHVCDPSAVAMEVAEHFIVKAQQQGIVVEVDVEQGVAPASIDYESIHEAVSNFVTNAIDACLMTEEGRKCSILIGFREEMGELIYFVQDSGCGMDEATRKKIFTNFFTTKGDNGTGIGLLMTKKLVQAHGGYIEVESEPGMGSTFSIHLPRKRLPNPIEE